MGHTKVRCKKPLVEEDTEQSGDFANGQQTEAENAGDNWTAPADGAEASWESKNESAGGW